MNRAQVEQAVMEFYRRRLTNELTPCLECFADHAMVRLAGMPRAGGVCTEVQGASGLRTLLEALTDAWKWTNQSIESVTIEGSRAAIRFMLTATHAPTGATVVTEIMDEIELNETHKIVSYVEFVDTAEAARLSA